MKGTVARRENGGVAGALTVLLALTLAVHRAGGRFGICGIAVNQAVQQIRKRLGFWTQLNTIVMLLNAFTLQLNAIMLQLNTITLQLNAN